MKYINATVLTPPATTCNPPTIYQELLKGSYIDLI